MVLLLSCTFNLALADNLWPTKVANIGCKFEYEFVYGKEKTKLEIIKHLSFPKILIEIDGAPPHGLQKLQHPDINRGSIRSLFTYSLNSSELDLRRLFPLKVGKSIKSKESAITKDLVKVLKYRKSPYFENSNEYLIQHSLLFDTLKNPPVYKARYQMWWNIELGFYTEDEYTGRPMTKKLSFTDCAPKNHKAYNKLLHRKNYSLTLAFFR